MSHPSFACILTVLLAGVSGDAHASDRVETLLEQVGRLQPTQQQRFVGWVELRLYRANQIVLPRAEAASIRASLRAKLRNGPLTWHDLHQLLDEMDTREREAIEVLTRHYRLQTLRTFRHARNEYSRRQQAWFDTYAAWRRAGRPLAEQDTLLDWLAHAIRASIPNSVTSLPESLRFGDRSLASLLPPVRPSPIATRQPTADPVPASEISEPAVSTASLPVAPRPALPANTGPVAEAGPNPKVLRKQAASLAAARRPDFAFKWNTAESAATASRPAAAPERVLLTPTEPRLSTLQQQDSLRATKMAPVPAPLADLHEQVAHEAPLPDRLGLHQTPEYPVRTADDGDLPFSQMLFPDLPIALDAEGPETQPLNRLPSEPALTTFSVSVSESLPRTVRDPALPRFSLERVVLDKPATKAPQEPPGRVNLTELRSRIAGTNMALKAMEAELYEPQDWTPAELSSRVTRLHILALRVEDSRLFRQSVPEDVRQLIDAASSPKPAITLLASQIAETRQRIADDNYRGTETERQAALSELDELSYRLVEIAALPHK